MRLTVLNRKTAFWVMLQNHKIAWTPRAGGPALHPGAFGELQEGDPTASGQPVPVVHHPLNCFLVFRKNFLHSSLYPLSLVMALGTAEKNLSPFRYLYTLTRFPLNLCFSRLNDFILFTELIIWMTIFEWLPCFFSAREDT